MKTVGSFEMSVNYYETTKGQTPEHSIVPSNFLNFSSLNFALNSTRYFVSNVFEGSNET